LRRFHHFVKNFELFLKFFKAFDRAPLLWLDLSASAFNSEALQSSMLLGPILRPAVKNMEIFKNSPCFLGPLCGFWTPLGLCA
jgi:hypothetical protein